ncbi:major capsid family protein, partial [Streptococcus pseudopneumoniae]|uniref:major capsid family protein n=1 Tax=Streptococcus pseudopneumoniae TaxID=257758 RepID=UPI0018B0C421
NTYGFLNDPGLPAYVSVPAGVGGSTWAAKTMDEICGDIRIILGALQDGSKGLVNVRNTPITLALSLAVVNQLTKINAFGMSVEDWLA